MINEKKNFHPDYLSGKPYFLEHLSNTCTDAGAHRTDYYSICFLSEGELKVETNLFLNHAKAPAFFVIAPDVIRSFLETGTNVSMTVLFFKKEYFLKSQADIHFLDKYDFFEQKDRHIIELNEKQFQNFSNYFQLIEQKIANASSHTSDIIRSFIYILLNEIDEIVNSNKNAIQTLSLSRNEQLLLEFKTLLSKYFLIQRQLAFYAGKLHVTPKHLSAAVKEASGKTAGDWIKEILLLESKVLLKDKQLTIAQIADKLDFTDPSHFGKFFKSHVGVSPLSFRG
nr:helix-turn-helix domain-containing protein [uncultured Draconibacterium sp.]